MSATEYGVFDTVDGCWLGTNDAGTGPRTFRVRRLAVALENVLRIRCGYAPWRLRVREYDGRAATVKDEITPKLSGEQATDLLGWNQLDAFEVRR